MDLYISLQENQTMVMRAKKINLRQYGGDIQLFLFH